MTGLSARDLERVVLATVLYAALIAVSLLFPACSPGDWGAYRDQAFWHDRDHVSP